MGVRYIVTSVVAMLIWPHCRPYRGRDLCRIHERLDIIFLKLKSVRSCALVLKPNSVRLWERAHLCVRACVRVCVYVVHVCVCACVCNQSLQCVLKHSPVVVSRLTSRPPTSRNTHIHTHTHTHKIHTHTHTHTHTYTFINTHKLLSLV